MTGKRKLATCAMGLATLMVLGFMAGHGLTDEGLGTLAWAVVVTTGASIGGNAAEHYAKRGQT